jgi:hypothetical protein
MNLSIVNGYNMDLSSTVSMLPNRVREIHYDQLLLNNFNVMLALMLLEMVVAGVLLAVGMCVPSFRTKSRTVAKHMLKEYLLMMVIFNSFNISYSLGVQVAYSDTQHDLFSLSIAVTAISILLPLAIVGVIIFTSKKEFGEFSSHYKPDYTSQGYFIATLLYRMVLGQSMGRLNEVEEATITNVFYAIVFLLYIIANLPYKKVYHNYRAVVVQTSGLIILSVTMFYRSMKSNTDPATTYQILDPALLEVAAIFSSLGISAGCLFYEFYLKYIQKSPIQTIK